MRLILFSALSLLLLFSACDNEPELGSGPLACLTFSDKDLFVGKEIFFDGSCSRNFDSIRWYMGDGTIVSLTSHNYAYLKSGDYTVSIVAYQGTRKDSVTKAIKIQKPAVILHNQEAIWKDGIWEEGIHEIEGFVSVVEGTLTIQPGTIIRLRPGASFQVGAQATSSVIAHGTAEKPIIFTSSLENPAPGSWNHVITSTYTNVASFKYCVFEYGGEGPYDAMLAAQYASSFSLEHCTFRHAANDGILLRDGSTFDLFQNNNMSDIQRWAIRMKPNAVPTVGLNNIIDNKGILVETQVIEPDLIIDTNLTLTKQTAPWAFTGNVTVGASAGATLTVAPGASLAFDNAYLKVGTDFGRPGKLVADGTAADSIKFTSVASTPWGGLYVGDYSAGESVIRYAHFKNAGTNVNTDAVLRVGATPVTIVNSKFSGTKLYGIDFSDNTVLNMFTNNVVGTGTKYSMRISQEELPVVQKSNVFKTGKDIFLRVGIVNQPNTIWQNLGVPYYVENTFIVGSQNGTASLIVEPGVTVRMKAGTTIYVGSTGIEKGTVKSIGTSAAKITFTLATETANANYPAWGGFRLYSTIGPETKFDYTVITGAENGIDMSATPAGLPVISNCHFENITEYGIFTVSSTPTLSNNTFMNCGWGNVKNQ